MLDSRFTRARWQMAILAGAVALLPAIAGAYTGSQVKPDFNPSGNNNDGDNNPATGLFNDPANWDTGRVPGSSADFFADANIQHNATATLDADVSGNTQLRNLQVGPLSAGAGAGTLYVTSTGNLVSGGVNVGTASGIGTLSVAGTFNAQAVNINTAGSTVTFAPGSTINFSAQYSVNISTGGTLNVQGGTINDVSDNNGSQIGGWRIYDGTVNHSAGSVQFARSLELGLNSGGTGNYNLSGTGTLTSTGVNIANGGGGALNISGGTLTGGAIHVASASSSGTGLIAVSGGTLGGHNVVVGNSAGSGSGTIRVSGNQGHITIGNNLANGNQGLGSGNAPLDLFANGTLNFVIGADGVSTIDLISANNAGDSRSISHLAGTLDMDLMTGFTPAENQVFDLVTTNVTSGARIDTTGLTLAAGDEASWTFQVVSNSGGAILQATYIGVVPEPASLGLLLMGGAALLGRKRRT